MKRAAVRMFGFRYYDEDPVDPDLPEHLRAIHTAEWVHLVARLDTKAARKAVALVLASFASEDGSDVRPAMPKVGRMCKLHETNAAAHAKALVELGLLVVKQAGGGRGNPTVYRLTRPADITALPLWLDPDMNEIQRDARFVPAETSARALGNESSPNTDSQVAALGNEESPSSSNTYSPVFTKGVSGPAEAETPAPPLPFPADTPVLALGYGPVDNSAGPGKGSDSTPKPQCFEAENPETPVLALGDLIQADQKPNQTPWLPQAATSLGWRERAAAPEAFAALVGPPKSAPWISPVPPAAPAVDHAAPPTDPRTDAPDPPPRIVTAAVTLAPTAEAAAAFTVLAAMPGEGEWWRHAAARELRRDGNPDPSAQDLAIRAAAILRRTDLERTA